jgi:hypothetical protein
MDNGHARRYVMVMHRVGIHRFIDEDHFLGVLQILQVKDQILKEPHVFIGDDPMISNHG